MGIGIPDRRWTILVIACLAFAGLLPLTTLRQRTGVMLSLTYTYTYSHTSFYGGIDQSSATYEFYLPASVDNLSQVLHSSQVSGYPLWLNVGDWEEVSSVTIRFVTAIIEERTTRSGYPCWRISLEDGDSLYYHEYLGIFIGSFWREISSSSTSTRRVDLSDDNIADLVNPGYLVDSDATIISLILIEALILIGIARRRR